MSPKQTEVDLAKAIPRLRREGDCMPKSSKYVTCPKCKGEFYVSRVLFMEEKSKVLFEQRDFNYCPFCQCKFNSAREKE